VRDVVEKAEGPQNWQKNGDDRKIEMEDWR
jgi:hypothetical protein